MCTIRSKSNGRHYSHNVKDKKVCLDALCVGLKKGQDYIRLKSRLCKTHIYAEAVCNRWCLTMTKGSPSPEPKNRMKYSVSLYLLCMSNGKFCKRDV